MKQFVIIIALCIGFQSVKSQTKVKLDGSGTVYVPITPAKKQDVSTDQVFVDKDGVKHPIYKNSKGRMYVVRKSKKTGKEYKQYLELASNS